MKAKAVDFVCYVVTDMEKSLVFYRDMLGLQLDAIHQGTWAEFSLGPVVLALCETSRWEKLCGGGGVEGGTGGGLALAVEDVSASVAELKSKGVAILNGPIEGLVCHIALITDPDGNRLWLHQRKDGTCG